MTENVGRLSEYLRSKHHVHLLLFGGTGIDRKQQSGALSGPLHHPQSTAFTMTMQTVSFHLIITWEKSAHMGRET